MKLSALVTELTAQRQTKIANLGQKRHLLPNMAYLCLRMTRRESRMLL
jgi:hypothetical protein